MKYKFLIYAGEMDSQDGPATIAPWLQAMTFEGSEEFWSQSSKVYHLDYPTTFVGGYYRQSEYFSYLRVPKAGHFVPNNNYWASYNFLKDYITNQQLNCHQYDGNCDVSSVMCAAMNECSQHGTCQTTGFCDCEQGWKGADCSMESTQLNSLFTGAEMKQYGPKYFSFTKSGSKQSTLELSSELPMDIFISTNATSNPTQFSHDMAVYQTKYAKLESQDVYFLQSALGYSVTAFVDAMDEAANQYLNNTVNVTYSESSQLYTDVKQTINGIMDIS